jgi:hypothetical protein
MLAPAAPMFARSSGLRRAGPRNPWVMSPRPLESAASLTRFALVIPANVAAVLLAPAWRVSWYVWEKAYTGFVLTRRSAAVSARAVGVCTSLVANPSLVLATGTVRPPLAVMNSFGLLRVEATISGLRAATSLIREKLACCVCRGAA